jgi:hypothetical protein
LGPSKQGVGERLPKGLVAITMCRSRERHCVLRLALPTIWTVVLLWRDAGSEAREYADSLGTRGNRERANRPKRKVGLTLRPEQKLVSLYNVAFVFHDEQGLLEVPRLEGVDETSDGAGQLLGCKRRKVEGNQVQHQGKRLTLLVLGVRVEHLQGHSLKVDGPERLFGKVESGVGDVRDGGGEKLGNDLNALFGIGHRFGEKARHRERGLH